MPLMIIKTVAVIIIIIIIISLLPELEGLQDVSLALCASALL